MSFLSLSEIEELAESGESESLAVLSKADRKSLERTACAIANTNGGNIVVGASPRKIPNTSGKRFLYDGIKVARKTNAAIYSVGESVDPNVDIEVESFDLGDNKAVFVLSIPQAENGNVRLVSDGKVWKRVGTENVEFQEKLVEATSSDSNEYLANPVADLGLSEKTERCLDAGNIRTVKDLVARSAEELFEIRSFGENELVEIRELLGSFDLSLRDETVADDWFKRRAESINQIFADLEFSVNSRLTFLNMLLESKGEVDVHSFAEKIGESTDSIHALMEALEATKSSSLETEGLDSVYEISTTAFRAIERITDALKNPNVGTAINFRRDATEDELCLGADKQAKVLSEFFNQASGDFNFGLFGHWGRGKTYLMDLVSELLNKEHKYETIRFSAWKYRSTPELWAHLYENFASQARNSHFMLWLFTPFRAGLARYGVWPIITAIFVLWFSLWKIDEKLFVAQRILQCLGIATVAYLGFLYVRMQAFSTKLYKYFDIASHRSSLGLQAAIGDDLKGLLTGWMPIDHWINCRNAEGNFSYWEFIKHSKWHSIATYLIGVVLVAIWLAPHKEGPVEYISIPIYGLIPKSAATAWGIYWPILGTWLTITIVYPLFAMFFVQGPKRVLLVVDDLDRCQPDQMLEIVESIMLFLDDPEIKKRLQIAMLVEEEAICTAIERKYEHLFAARDVVDEKRRSTVIQENIEKIFLVYLRLPETNDKELHELFDRFIDAPATETNNPKGSLTPEAPRIDDSDQVGQPSDIVNDNEESRQLQNANASSANGKDEIFISLHEKNEILSLVDEIQKHDIRWGPRAARCFINKYQLARAIYRKLHPGRQIEPKLLVEALSAKELSTELKQLPEANIVCRICEQIK